MWPAVAANGLLGLGRALGVEGLLAVERALAALRAPDAEGHL